MLVVYLVFFVELALEEDFDDEVSDADW